MDGWQVCCMMESEDSFVVPSRFRWHTPYEKEYWNT
jgi:hypothetical protein